MNNLKQQTMEWYKKLDKSKKVHIRWAFEVCTGISLNNALKLFSFSECMDLLESKLKIEGFNI